MAEDLRLGVGRLQLYNSTPRGYGRPVGGGFGRVAPVVPPKPKTNQPASALDVNVDITTQLPPPVSSIPPPLDVESDLDLPPPPPELYAELPSASEVAGNDAPPHMPSPVSSSYSELRRHDPHRTLPNPQQEAELDALTQTLLAGLDQPQSDVHGICGRCSQPVVGEGGCTAIDKVYHVHCFTCHVCNTMLQSQPFYMAENHPHCHTCYVGTLEKCCVCNKAVLDRLLRATGRPYHPACFVCVECGQCLDGVSFTVDAGNNVYCIQDFHKKFAPKCSVCELPIMPPEGQEETVRVVALDRSFHVDCYKCEDCGLVLSSEADGRGCFPLDGHVLCRSCNIIRINKLTA